jgi:hypothetical protein
MRVLGFGALVLPLARHTRLCDILQHGALLLLPQQSKVRAVRARLRDALLLIKIVRVLCLLRRRLSILVFHELCAHRHCCGSVCCGIGLLLLSAGIVLALSAALAVTALINQSVRVCTPCTMFIRT